MKMSRDFMRVYLIPFILLIGLLVAGIFGFVYSCTARTQDGKIISSIWPRNFTIAFSQYISRDGDTVVISDTGKEALEENGLWIQVLDEAGAEVLNYKKPSDIPNAYQPYELLQAYQEGEGGTSVFINNIESDDVSYTYLIGFPLSVSKVVTYVDAERYKSGKSYILVTILVTVLLLLILTIFYNFVISKNLEKICASLRSIAARTYTSPNRKNRFLREIYEGIDLLNKDITAADVRRKQDEKAKEEWLANITHDLKTPLAPIRGYAELLAEGESASVEQTKRYGKIMLKNVLYTEHLVDDLKLTYQLQSNMLPLKKESQNIVCFVKEVVIDLLNSPDYERRNISFLSDCENKSYEFDEKLFRRALTNIIVNALKHNTNDTKITVSIKCSDEEIYLVVSDNGSGMTEQELEGLFQRYYRGTSTETKAEGTGLGMAIANQIVKAHGGEICAESTIGVGTTITIRLPKI